MSKIVLFITFFLYITTQSSAQKVEHTHDISNVILNEDSDDQSSEKFQSEFTPYKIENQFGFENSVGHITIPAKYAYVSQFTSNGLAKVIEPNSKFGFINTKGDYVIEPHYDLATSFIGDHSYVFQSNQFHRIDKFGEILNSYHSTIYEINFLDFAFSDYVIFKTKLGLYGVVHKNGQLHIKPEYNYITLIKDKAFLVTKTINKQKRHFVINSNLTTQEYTGILFSENFETGQQSIKGINITDNSNIFFESVYYNKHSNIMDKNYCIHSNTMEEKSYKYQTNISYNDVYPIIRYTGIQPPSVDSSLNKKHDNSFTYLNDTLVLSPKNTPFKTEHFRNAFVTDIEFKDLDGAWKRPLHYIERGKDGRQPSFKDIDTSFAYHFSIPQLNGDLVVDSRYILKTINSNNDTVEVKSDIFKMRIPSYFFADLDQFTISKMIEY